MFSIEAFAMGEFAERVSRWFAWLAGAVILFGCALPISIDVISRLILGRTVVESFEISGYALAACIGLGMGYTVTSKANVRVDVLTARLPRGLRLGFDLLASMALAATAIAFAYYTFDVLKESLKLDARSVSTLRVPLILPQSIWWVGFAWFATVACLTPILALIRIISRDLDGAETLISNPDLSDEMKEIGIESARSVS
jgi:TRAP-type C4-dicarboxylate transport system permease small subunit